MKVEVSSIIEADPEKVFEVVQTKRLLFYVMCPMASFKIISPIDDNVNWKEGETYIGWSFLFLVIPVWKRKIYLERIDDKDMQIQPRESGEIGLRKWDHLIMIEETVDGRTMYTDIVEIDAGIFTLPYYLFASVFYRHRQSRWRNLAKNNLKF